MPGTAVVDSGNYDLKIATGFQVDAFVLDDTHFGTLGGTIENYDSITTTYDDTIVYDGTQDPNGNRLG